LVSGAVSSSLSRGGVALPLPRSIARFFVLDSGAGARPTPPATDHTPARQTTAAHIHSQRIGIRAANEPQWVFVRTWLPVS